MITYERQNKWMTDYLLPLVTGEWSKIPENYKNNKAAAHEAERDALRADMQKAGVFESLHKLETEGPECDKPFKEFADAIDRKYVDYKYDKIFRFGGELGGPGIEHFFYMNNRQPVFFCSDYAGTIKPTIDEKTLQMVCDMWKVSEQRHDDFPRGPAGAA